MNEVEKMYRNAHVYPRVYGDITKETFEDKAFNMADMCNEAFTAEKQIELIKWLSKFNLRIEQPDYAKGYYFIETHTGVYSKFLPIFEEALAGLINDLWQNLTAEERKQVKGILK